METQLEQFKQFVREYPGLREEVRANRTTWQALYEEWYLYGSDDVQWDKYKTVTKVSEAEVVSESESETVEQTTSTAEKSSNISGTEVMTQAFQYLQKMDMNKVQQTVGTVQQFVKLFQSFSGGGGASGAAAASSVASSATRDTYPGLFSKFDD